MTHRMIGLPDDHDRRWIIHTPSFDAQIADYNWELTGFDERLGAMDANVFHYGGNAYYITGAYAKQKGWTVESVPRALTNDRV